MGTDNFYLQFDEQRLMAIHRQWIRTNVMKGYFDALLPKQVPDLSDPHAFENYFISDANTFMYTWYGYLFSILEATRDGVMKHIDTSLDKPQAEAWLCKFFGISESLFAGWKKLRNTTFHIRSDYYDIDMFKLMYETDAGKTIRAIHSRIGDMLLNAIEIHMQKP